MAVARAEWRDRLHFARLWNAYLRQQFEAGGVVKPTHHNYLEYLRLYEAYTIGGLFGFCLLARLEVAADPVGIILVGEPPMGGMKLETTQGRTCTLWGVYTAPEARRLGVAWALQDAALREAGLLGFQTGVSSVLVGYTDGEGNAFNWGALAREWLIQIPINQGHTYGRQRR